MKQTREPADLALRELAPGRLAEAAAVLARGMRDNPTHRRIFGSDPDLRQHRLARFYLRALPQLSRRATILGACRRGRLVAVLALAGPGRCQPSGLELARVMPAFLYGEGALVALRLRRWIRAWARRDPHEPHWHLGPAAVDAGFQRQGIGSALLPDICDWLDGRAATAYLETERPANVRLYERFGFTVTGRGTVLDVPCWFMTRPAKAP